MTRQTTATHLTRQELYELVWAEPMSKLAERFDISDRGLAKICSRASVPVPERGYWARVQAGQERDKTPLPAPTADTPQQVAIRPPAPHILQQLLTMAAGVQIPSESKQLETDQKVDENPHWHGELEHYTVEAEQKKDEILLARLLQQARDHRTATEIRQFVSHVAASSRADQPEEFSAWRDWALKQADKLDPLRSERLFDRTVSNTELWSHSRAIGG